MDVASVQVDSFHRDAVRVVWVEDEDTSQGEGKRELEARVCLEVTVQVSESVYRDPAFTPEVFAESVLERMLLELNLSVAPLLLYKFRMAMSGSPDGEGEKKTFLRRANLGEGVVFHTRRRDLDRFLDFCEEQQIGSLPFESIQVICALFDRVPKGEERSRLVALFFASDPEAQKYWEDKLRG